MGRSLDKRGPTGCGMTQSDVETSTMWRRRSEYDCCATRNKMCPSYSWFLVALCPFPEANKSLSNVYILIRLVPCGHINVQKAISSMRLYSYKYTLQQPRSVHQSLITEAVIVAETFEINSNFDRGFTDQHLNIIHKTVNYHDQFRMLIFNVNKPTFTR